MARSMRRWLEPRLLLGIALITASVVGMAGLVLAIDRTATAWSSPSDLVPGDVVRLGDLEPRPVRLDLVEGAYLVGDLDPELEAVVLRSVGAGELIPTAAIGDAAALATAVVVVPIDGPIASGIAPGATADVWAAAPEATSGFASPAIIVTGAVIGRVVQEHGIVASGSVAVELVVPRSRVARVLEALADGAAVSIVPAVP